MEESEIPETHVLAIASHVTAGYVGNTMATFCLQTLGCEVSAINTVNYSNHVGYRRFTGRKTLPEEIRTLYTGLQNARLNDFHILLSGYSPTAAVLQIIGDIARERREQSAVAPGSFFWVLDPVMGDNGRVYVEEAEVPVYRELVMGADLVLPNAFEAELLTGVKIDSLSSLKKAIATLHKDFGVPHVVVTSISLPSSVASANADQQVQTETLTMLGSTATSSLQPRFFRVTIPAFPVFFSGTGDMFAALLTARLRQFSYQDDLLSQPSWRSPDEVLATDLPLARAAEMVLRSMQVVLGDTAKIYEREKGRLDGAKGEALGEDERHLRLTRAAEVRVVRHVESLRRPPAVEGVKAQGVEQHGQ